MKSYLVHNKKAHLLLKAVDAILSCFPTKDLPAPLKIEKILLCNGAHLGDVILSTSVLPLIKTAYPDAKIGFLVGSWAKELLSDHMLVDFVHLLDHWKLNRSPLGKIKKINTYFRNRRQVIAEIKNQKYDLAIDLYPFFPNHVSILYAAHIPIRVGYTSAGWGCRLTHPIDWLHRSEHILDHFLDLLHAVNIDAKTSAPSLIYRKALPKADLPPSYVVFHMGAGDQKKEWNPLKWRAVLKEFTSLDKRVIFTGLGKRENELIQTVMGKDLPAINLCNALTIKELISVIQHAESVVSVDSAVAHIASAFSIPTTVLYSGINDITLWRPLNPNLKVAFSSPPCFPCLKKGGCASMECIQNIEVSDVCRGL
ncbi:MAG: hypothetical protein RLZZ453_476 [Chlamydiota bacterium]|jgi:ADP-heptose:LPS heptosyltransferase